MSDIQSSEVDRLLSVWQYASEIPLAVLCRKHPELLAQLELKISIIRHIQRLAPPPVSSDNIFTLSVDDTTISPAEQSTVPPVLLFGESIDCYRLVRVLGQGGMGIVWEAEDTSFSRLVALKMMLPGLLTHEKARDRFLREARAQAAVLHEHVAVIHAVGERDGVPFIVMPLLSGATLADRLLAEPGLNLTVYCA